MLKELQQIKALEDQISRCRIRIHQIKEACTHKESKPEYVETFAHEFDPHMVCIVCRKKTGEPTREQKLQLLKEWYDDIETDLTDKMIEEKINGFSL